MHKFSAKYLRCVRCHKTLELEIIKESIEIIEGFLECKKCNLSFPIISNIPILWDDFSAFLSTRTLLGGELLLKSKSSKMKKFVKNSLSNVKRNLEDRTLIEQRWAKIYHNSKNSNFYLKILNHLNKIPRSEFVLEHGCSIGLACEKLAKKHDIVFGIDSSFASLIHAKKTKTINLDYFVADSLFHPFGNQKFGLVVALNLLEIVEPTKLLQIISNQVRHGFVLLSDPYDYMRDQKSVKTPVDAYELRAKLKNLGFKITPNTKKPSFVSWNLILNERASLNYKVDVLLLQR